LTRACLLALAACHPPHPPVSAHDASELVTAIVDDWTSTHATLRLWKHDGTSWRAVGDPWPAVIGKTGTAWGIGRHGSGPPPGRSGPIKREGDGKSPAGMFWLGDSLGTSESAPEHSSFPYMRLDEHDECVDDPGSSHYGRILDRTQVTVDWKSAEQMQRTDELYRWVVTVDHNAGQTPGGGSCIFLHVWSGPDSTTVGCTAMAEPQLAHLIGALHATTEGHPIYVLLPRGEYDALAAPWGLPAQ